MVPKEATAKHDESVEGLILLKFIIQEATDGRKERED
jgi:hypothetical protein